MYIQPTLLPEAALPPKATLPPGTYSAKPSATSAELNLYEPASSNRNAAYSQHYSVRSLLVATLSHQIFLVLSR
jgi:hypothetical protein